MPTETSPRKPYPNGTASDATRARPLGDETALSRSSIESGAGLPPHDAPRHLGALGGNAASGSSAFRALGGEAPSDRSEPRHLIATERGYGAAEGALVLARLEQCADHAPRILEDLLQHQAALAMKVGEHAAAGGALAASRRLETEANQAVFWSGVRGRDAAAAAWAEKNGGTTLEKSLEKRGIELPAWPKSGEVPAEPCRPMEKMKADAAGRVSEALVIWVAPIPSDDYDGKAALTKRFGGSGAAELEPALQALEDEFFESDARHVAADLQDMHRRAFADFKRKHPEISDEAVHALAASYTFTYK